MNSGRNVKNRGLDSPSSKRSYNENSESERSLNKDDDDDDDYDDDLIVRHDYSRKKKKQEEDDDDSSSDYVISSDSDMDGCPLFTNKKSNVLGLKRRKKIKKGTSVVNEDDSIAVLCSQCCKYFLNSCCWTLLATLICLLILGLSCCFEFKWWYSYTIEELGKGMYYLNNSHVHPYKVELPNDRVYIWHDEKVHRYCSRFSYFSRPMVVRAGRARLLEKRDDCHKYNLVQYKDKYHRPNDPAPNATEAQMKEYLGACILLGNMTEQSWDLEVKFQKHIEDIFGVPF